MGLFDRNVLVNYFDLVHSGVSYHQLDAEGRVAIPIRFRQTFAEIVMEWKEGRGFVTAWPTHTFRQIVAEVNGGASKNERERLDLAIESHTIETRLDPYGRFSIPWKIRYRTGVGRELAIVGVGTHIELWHLERWHDILARSSS